jgi:PhnB protein
MTAAVVWLARKTETIERKINKGSKMQLSAYLNFDGRCEEALRFYEAAGLGKVTDLRRYEGSPIAANVPAEKHNKIMHAYMEGPGVSLHASDSMRPNSAGFSGFGLTIGLSDVAEANRLFTALSEGGQVTMPMQKQFWGATFGMFTDKFGVSWMINCGDG